MAQAQESFGNVPASRTGISKNGTSSSRWRAVVSSRQSPKLIIGEVSVTCMPGGSILARRKTERMRASSSRTANGLDR